MTDSDLKYLLSKSNRWNAYLYPVQLPNIGRFYLELNRSVKNLMDINPLESMAIFTLGKRIEQVVNKMFSPDIWNHDDDYKLDLDSPVQFHHIPRYKEPRKFEGVTFKEQHFGKHHHWYALPMVLDDKLILRIRDKLAEELERLI